MKQVLQDLRGGATRVVEVPCPAVQPGCLLVRNEASLISAGTERMLVRFGRATLLEKARQNPERVRQALEKVRSDGVLATLDAVRTKLETPLPLGYSSAGIVVAVGTGVAQFRVGDRVASNGAHAELVCVPEKLCASVPTGVTAGAAAFTAVTSVSLHGIRLLEPSLGESCVVIGLGLLGLLAIQMLQAAGVRVLGFDVDAERCQLARGLGAHSEVLEEGADPVAMGVAFGDGIGVDSVLITASTFSNDPVNQAARMCRKRGRIVQVGLTGLALERDSFYMKELSFRVACSYGPGRYDAEYEDKGHDYPLGYVRWTEQRNFGAVLDMLARGRLNVEPLVSHRIPVERAGEAYELMQSDRGVAILLEYPGNSDRQYSLDLHTVEVSPGAGHGATGPAARGEIVVGVIGAGNFAVRTLLPLLPRKGCRREVIASQGGVNSGHAARKFGFTKATTNGAAVLGDPTVNSVLVLTRHDSHARYVVEGLRRGHAVFVEKPLCLSLSELQLVAEAYAAATAPNLMVGFNRRFAPHILLVRRLLEGIAEPKCFVMTVNAGVLRADHWSHDPAIGGGRLVAEGVHFVDLLRFLAGAPIVESRGWCVGDRPGMPTRDDQATIALRFSDGSWGAIHYLGNGAASFPKERLEVFVGGRVLQLDNYRALRGFGWPGFRLQRALWRDKGHRACLDAWLASVRTGGPAPIAFAEIEEVHRVIFALRDSMRVRS